MSKIENNLIAGESILYRANISWAAFIMPVVLSIVLIWMSTKVADFVVVIVVIFTLYILLRILLAILSTEFVLTNRRIIAKRGIIRQHSIELMLSQVESISISQTLDGRLFGFGTVTISGSGGTHEYFKSISKPMELRKQVNDQLTNI